MGNIFKRILGGIIILTAVAIIGASVFGAVQVGDALAQISTSIGNTLQFTSTSLTTAGETITLTQQTIAEVGTGLDTASTTMVNVSGAIADSQPFLTNVSGIVTQDLPDNLDAVQAALPAVVQVAGVIDTTLSTLNGIGFNKSIDLPFGQSIPIQWDLGINYDPAVPFDETLSTLEETLSGLPTSLRGLEADLTVTTDNLGVLSANMLEISDDLSTINQSVAELVPLLDQYTVLINDLQTSIASAQERIPAQLDMLRTAIIFVLILLALSQLTSLYVGWELLSGRRDQQAANIVVTQSKEVPSEAQ